MDKRRVVITGMGAVTPLGRDIDEVWRKLLSGESGVSLTKLFDARTFPSQFSAQVADYDHLENVPENLHDEVRQAGRNSRFIITAALQAWRQAGLPMPMSATQTNRIPGSDRVGVYLGAGEGPLDFKAFSQAAIDGWNTDENEMDWGAWATTAFSGMDMRRELEQEPNIPSGYLARLFQLRGPCMSCLTACAASTQAIGEATEQIRYGDTDIMITGGTHSMIHPLGVTGFNRLTALSTRNDDYKTSSRPFDRTRDGFVLAEGAGAIILEDYETARKRGAPILAEVIGYGSTADAFRVTDQHIEGRGGIAAVRQALADAGLDITDIDYISAHGTGTAENDSIETKVIKDVFGEQAYNIPVSSVKSMLGHLIAAAGVVELITCVLALRDQVIPPTINLHQPDEVCDLDYVPNEPRPALLKTVMSNSFGFGGQNNTIIIRQLPEQH